MKTRLCLIHVLKPYLGGGCALRWIVNKIEQYKVSEEVRSFLWFSRHYWPLGPP